MNDSPIWLQDVGPKKSEIIKARDLREEGAK